MKNALMTLTKTVFVSQVSKGASYPCEIKNYARGNTAQWIAFSVAIK
jgi:hypothetical protein